jgi:dUTP pyrophosphatase
LRKKGKIMEIVIKRLSDEATLPCYATAGAAGAVLYALSAEEVAPGEKTLVHTGVAMAIPEGYVGLVYARSGLATKRDLAPANMVGVIDADYRGEIMVCLRNYGKELQRIEKGERVAQLVIAPVTQAIFTPSDSLPDTQRGEGGFGSTGKL